MEKKTQEEVTALIVGTFSTELGQKLLKHLKDVIIDRETYREGFTLDQCAFREGQKDIVNQILKEFKNV